MSNYYNSYCPVQASINAYCAYGSYTEDDAMGDAIDTRKEELMKQIDAEDISEALCEVPDNAILWHDIIRAVTRFNQSHVIDLSNADDVIRGIYSAVENYIEKQAEQQIKHERDNPPPSQRDYDDDH